MERDFWDILALVATISTGVVIALAATLAFVVQRARYFREVTPILVLDNGRIELDPPLGSKFIPRLRFRVDNDSNNGVRNIRLRNVVFTHANAAFRTSKLKSRHGGILPTRTLGLSAEWPPAGFVGDGVGYWECEGELWYSPSWDMGLLFMNWWSLGVVSHKIWFRVQDSFHNDTDGGTFRRPTGFPRMDYGPA